MVPRAGLEPAQRERRGILNPLCLPIPPPGHAIKRCRLLKSKTPSLSDLGRENEVYFNGWKKFVNNKFYLLIQVIKYRTLQA